MAKSFLGRQFTQRWPRACLHQAVQTRIVSPEKEMTRRNNLSDPDDGDAKLRFRRPLWKQLGLSRFFCRLWCVCVQFNSGRNPPRGGTYIVNISKQTTLRSLSLFVTSIKNKAVIHRDYMLRLFSFCNNFVRHINTIPHKTIRIIEKKHIYI